MAEQHRYEINLKQGDLFINLSSDDLYFISKQMDKWCQILMDDSYIPISIPSTKLRAENSQGAASPLGEAPSQPVPVVPPQQPAYATPEQAYVPPQFQQAAYSEPPPAYQAVPPQQAPVEAQQQQLPYQPAPPAPPQPVLRSEPVPLPQPQPVLAQPAPVVQSVPQVPQQDEFEVVMDSLMKEFEETPPVPAAPTLPFPSPALNRPDVPTQGPDLSGVSTLMELCDRAHADSSEDYLLLSAFYINCFEGEERFSLKRINSMLVKSGLTPVNHSVLEVVLGHGYLSMVPDLTGTAEVSEYVLTSEGQQATWQLF